MRELFATGLRQSSLYGAEVTGLDSTQLKEARASFLSLVGSPAGSSSTALALDLVGGPTLASRTRTCSDVGVSGVEGRDVQGLPEVCGTAAAGTVGAGCSAEAP